MDDFLEVEPITVMASGLQTSFLLFLQAPKDRSYESLWNL